MKRKSWFVVIGVCAAVVGCTNSNNNAPSTSSALAAASATSKPVTSTSSTSSTTAEGTSSTISTDRASSGTSARPATKSFVQQMRVAGLPDSEVTCVRDKEDANPGMAEALAATTMAAS